MAKTSKDSVQEGLKIAPTFTLDEYKNIVRVSIIEGKTIVDTAREILENGLKRNVKIKGEPTSKEKREKQVIVRLDSEQADLLKMKALEEDMRMTVVARLIYEKAFKSASFKKRLEVALKRDR